MFISMKASQIQTLQSTVMVPQLLVINFGYQAPKGSQMNYPSIPSLMIPKSELGRINNESTTLKEVVDIHVDSIRHPNESINSAFNIQLGTIVNIGSAQKKGEVIVVLLYDDENNESVLQHEFITKVLNKVAGIKPVSKRKEIEEILLPASESKKKNKARTMKARKVMSKARKARCSSEASSTMKVNRTFFGPEAMAFAMAEGRGIGANSVPEQILDSITNNNLLEYDKIGLLNVKGAKKLSKSDKKSMSKKEIKKYEAKRKHAKRELDSAEDLYKATVAKNKSLYKNAKEAISILHDMDEDLVRAAGLHKTPKLERGTKKAKKGGKREVKMSNKACVATMEYFGNGNGVMFGRIVMMHNFCISAGNTPNDKAYSDLMIKALNGIPETLPVTQGTVPKKLSKSAKKSMSKKEIKKYEAKRDKAKEKNSKAVDALLNADERKAFVKEFIKAAKPYYAVEKDTNTKG